MTNFLKCLLGALVLVLLSGGGALAENPADFTVESPVSGAKFRLSDGRGKYVAIHFLLKTECPFCLRHTREYAKKMATRPDLVQIFLKPDSAEAIREWSARLGEEAGKQVTLYRDADAALAKAFGIPHGYRFHGEVVHFPALILLDPAGREVFRYVGKNNTDRFGFESLTAKIDELKKAASEGVSKSEAQTPSER